MTTRRVAVTAIGAMLCGLAQLLAQGASLEGDLQRAKQREVTDGCKTVLADYTRIADQAAKNSRPIAAEALLRAAMCHEQLNDGKAPEFYARVASEFKGSPQASEADRRLATVSNATPAARFLSGQDGVLSPDAKVVAFRKDFDLVLQDVTSRTVRTLILHPSEEEGVCTDVHQPFIWARDAKQLAYLWCFHPDVTPKRLADLLNTMEDGWGGRELRIASADGKKVSTVLNRQQTERFGFTGADEGLVDWSPDGDTIVLSALDFGPPASVVMSTLSLKDGSMRDFLPGRRSNFTAARISPDSRSIAYTRRKTDGPGTEVCLLTLADGAPQPILHDQNSNQFIDWTPNGKGLVFLSNRSGTYDVGLVHTDGANLVDPPVWLVRDTGPFWLPVLTSAGALVYSVTAGNIYGTSSQNLGDVYLVATDPVSGKVLSEPASVSQGPGHTAMPLWARDGRLAYKSGPGGPILPNISIVTIASGTARVLKTSLSSPRFDWSPDGKSFLQGRLLQLIDVETGKVTVINEGTAGELPKFFPDGKSVVYRTAQNKLMRLDLATKEERPLVTLAAGLQIASYAFAPDGHAVALTVHDREKNVRDIRIMSLDNSTIHSLVNVSTAIDPGGGAAWSPDSSFLIYADATADALLPNTAIKRSELWRIPAAGGRPEKLGLTFDRITHIAIAPDGRHLAFQFDPEVRPGLFAIDHLLPPSELRRK